ncbi:MAG: hypothetical protein KC800_20640, partial [Candidatus Eremiobacteraeota bacterium]|nr:hypothetical protein [Candidatus Eremiobacteraeota bacterium]
MLKATGSSHTNFIPLKRQALSNGNSAATVNPEPQGARDTVNIGSLSSAQPAADARPTIVEGEVLVKTKSSLFKSDQESLLDSLGASVKERFEFPKDLFKSFDGEVMRLQLPDGLSTKEALAKLADDPRVDYAVPNEIIYLDEVTQEDAPPSQGSTDPGDIGGRKPNDLDPKLWGLHNRGQNGGKNDADIDAPEAWAKTTGSNDVLVAVIDTGV